MRGRARDLPAVGLARFGLVLGSWTLASVGLAFVERSSPPERPPAGAEPRAGIPVPALALEEAGVPLSWVATPGQPSLLLELAAGCGACEANAPFWRALLEVVGDPERGRLPVEVLFLTEGDEAAARAFLARHGLSGRVLRLVARDAWDALAGPVPRTMLIDAAGRVRRTRTGARGLDELESWWDDLALAFDASARPIAPTSALQPPGARPPAEPRPR